MIPNTALLKECTSIENMAFSGSSSVFSAKYGELEVLIRKEDGYINATDLCRDNGSNFRNWVALKSTKSLLKEVEKTAGVLEPLRRYYGGREIFAHPLLIPHLASWLSPNLRLGRPRL